MTYDDRDGIIWFDGKIVPWRQATTHFLTHSLHYGYGVFEGLRVYKTSKGMAIFRLWDHTRRLFDSAKILQMQIPFSFDEIMDAQRKVLREMDFDTNAYIRPLVFYGAKTMGLSVMGNVVHVGIAAFPWGTYLGERALEDGIRVKISSFTRHHVNATMCRAKTCGNYINSIMANSEARDHGYDEALLLDVDGFVAEGSGANIFVIRDSEIITPDLASCLDGITRRTVMQICADLGYTVKEGRITRDGLYIADEAFLTGSAAEITPICSVDNRIIGSGKKGMITEKIQAAFFDIVYGRNNKFDQWLDYI